MRSKNIILILLSAIFILLQYANFKNSSSIGEIYSGWSLRYDTSSNALKSISEYASENIDKYGSLNFHYWTETKVDISGDMNLSDEISNVNCISYSGDPYAVYPFAIASGRLPSEMETDYCAVSTELSWQLWRSLDTVGRIITMDGKSMEVCGVFEEEDTLMLCAGIETTKWNNIEITYPSDIEMTRENIEGLVTESSIDIPDHIIDGALIKNICNLTVYIPLTVLYIVLIILYMNSRSEKSPYKILITSGIAIIFAIMISVLVYRLPNWLLPTKWSDFAFWQGLFEKFVEYTNDFFLIKPYSKDLLFKINSGKLVIILFLQMVMCMAISVNIINPPNGKLTEKAD